MMSLVYYYNSDKFNFKYDLYEKNNLSTVKINLLVVRLFITLSLLTHLILFLIHNLKLLFV